MVEHKMTHGELHLAVHELTGKTEWSAGMTIEGIKEILSERYGQIESFTYDITQDRFVFTSEL